MTAIIIKHLFIYICCIYMYCNILNDPKRGDNILSCNLPYAVYAILTAISASVLRLTIPGLSYVLPLLLLWILLSLTPLCPQVTMQALIISFSASYSIFILSSLPIIILQNLILHTVKYTLTIFLSGMLSLLIVFFLCRIRRLKSGMPFLYSAKSISLGAVISVLFLTVLTYIQLPCHFTRPAKLLTICLLISAVTAIIFWWKSQLAKSYISRLKSLELESLRNELLEGKKHIHELRSENERLGRLLHKDNKLIPAMENAVYELLISQWQGEPVTISRCQALLSEIQQFSDTRQNSLNAVSADASRSFKTGITALDILLAYTHKRALLSNISFSAALSGGLDRLVPSIISAPDLVHILSNLIDNAMIATSNSAVKDILLQIYCCQKAWSIELSDTGAAFEINTLHNLGLVPGSTHAANGGNGIGLLDIWSIRNQYQASLHITEYKVSSPFTKKIAFTLDKRQQYVIYTYRAEEIISGSRRFDMLVFSSESEDSP